MKYLGFAIWVVLTLFSGILFAVSLFTLLTEDRSMGPGAPLEGVARAFNIGILVVCGLVFALCIRHRLSNNDQGKDK